MMQINDIPYVEELKSSSEEAIFSSELRPNESFLVKLESNVLTTNIVGGSESSFSFRDSFRDIDLIDLNNSTQVAGIFIGSLEIISNFSEVQAGTD